MAILNGRWPTIVLFGSYKIGVEKCNDRKMMVKTEARPANTVIIQVYRPTSEQEGKEALDNTRNVKQDGKEKKI